MPSAAERFQRKYAVDSVSGCWNWTACKVNRYGLFRVDRLIEAKIAEAVET